MSALYAFGALVASLYGIYILRNLNKADRVIGNLSVQPKAEELKDAAEVARLTQEIKDAKVNYAADAERVRLEYLKSRGQQ